MLHLNNLNHHKISKLALSQAGVPYFWPIHLHCFNEGWETCQKWMKAYPNMKFGFVLPYLDDVVQRIPLDRVLLETDAPYFPAAEDKLIDLVHISLYCGPVSEKLFNLFRVTG